MMDRVQKAAEFVKRNGAPFLKKLCDREYGNPNFAFLDAQRDPEGHSYFQSLINAQPSLTTAQPPHYNSNFSHASHHPQS